MDKTLTKSDIALAFALNLGGLQAACGQAQLAFEHFGAAVRDCLERMPFDYWLMTPIGGERVAYFLLTRIFRWHRLEVLLVLHQMREHERTC